MFTLTTAGSSIDTLLAVYQGSSVSNLTLVASNDDTDPAKGVLTSSVTFRAVAGEFYQLAVDGFDGAGGRIVLNLGRAKPSLGVPSRLSNGAVRFAVSGVPGQSYDIQASLDLREWLTIGTVPSSHSSEPVIDGAATNLDRRFYRALLPLAPAPLP